MSIARPQAKAVIPGPARDPMRRSMLRVGAGLTGGLLLGSLVSGCGFAPRGSARLPFSRVYISAPSASPFASELRRSLRANGVDLATRRDDAPARFELLGEGNEREITALSTAGRPREYQVRLRLRWQLRDGSDRLLIQPTETILRRTITVLDAQGQLNLEEESLMVRDMRTDAAQQIVRRLSVVRLP